MATLKLRSLLRLAHSRPLIWAHACICKSVQIQRHYMTPHRISTNYAIARFQGFRRPYTTVMEEKGHCWACKEELNRHLICPKCSSIQAPDLEISYFDIFELPVNFDIDARELEKSFKNLQWQLHPDKVSFKPQLEQQFSHVQSSLVNKAYQVLKNPLKRGLYMLELYGKPVEEGQTSQDVDFLMEVMEVNEELEDAKTEEDVAEIRKRNQVNLDKSIADAKEAFEAKNIDEAREILSRMQYYDNIHQLTQQWSPGKPNIVLH
eukprot:Colp12_sorted_trinity150504_noHs@21425